MWFKIFSWICKLFYKFCRDIGRPFDEDLLLKIVDKLWGKIGERLHIELINWFITKKDTNN